MLRSHPALTTLCLSIAACADEPVEPLLNPALTSWSAAGPDAWQLWGPRGGVVQRAEQGAEFHSVDEGAVALFQDARGPRADAPFEASAWVRTQTADAVDLVVSTGSGAWHVASARHPGDSSWQQLKVRGTVPDDADNLRVHIWARSGATVTVRDVALSFGSVPLTARLPRLAFALALLLAVALVAWPASRRRLAAHFSQAPATAARPERFFVAIGATFGLLFCFLIAPLQVPDEPAHLRRAIQLSQLELRPTVRDEGGLRRWGAVMPVSIYETELALNLFESAFKPEEKISVRAIIEELRRPYANQNRAFYSFGSPAMYAPLPYLPQLAAVLVGRGLGASPLVLLYLARLFNLATFLLLVRFAIRLAPVAKWGFVALALSPMALSQASSASPDTLTNALSLLAVALFLSFAADGEAPLTRRQLGLLFAVCVSLALAKQLYLFLSVLFLLIPVRRLGGPKRYVATLAAIVGAQLAATGGWWALSMRGHSFARDDANPAQQLAFVFERPLHLVRILIDTNVAHYKFYLSSYVGNLGWLTVPLPAWAVLTYLSTVAVVALCFSGERSVLARWQRLLVFAPAPAIWAVILAYHYLIWTPPRGDLVEGGQGRYLIPLSPLVMIACAAPAWRWRGNPDAIRWPLAAVLSLLLCVTLVLCVRRFYL